MATGIKAKIAYGCTGLYAPINSSGYPNATSHAARSRTMSNQPLTEEEILGIRAQLRELQVEHRDLDQIISHLITNPPPDDLLIRRIKKRKLALKDRIQLLEEMLVPDIPA